MRIRQSRKGMVLLFALWVLGILTILAVSVASGIRQKIALIGRLDERIRMAYVLEAAVKKTAGYIHQQIAQNGIIMTPTLKMNLLNNTAELGDIRLGPDIARVSYMSSEDGAVHGGVVDEESKINLNKTDPQILTNLLMRVFMLKEEAAVKLSASLIDWRQNGESEITGFFSDEYYTNLQFPYPKKSADFETLDEILLVKGMTKSMYTKLLDFVTIYGDGAVNINTAPKEVLEALGLSDELVDKILTARRGHDNEEGTRDDFVFTKTFDVAIDVNALVKLNAEEAQAIDALNSKNLLTVNSFYFMIEAKGQLASKAKPGQVRAVYSGREDKIIYWKER